MNEAPFFSRCSQFHEPNLSAGVRRTQWAQKFYDFDLTLDIKHTLQTVNHVTEGNLKEHPLKSCHFGVSFRFYFR